MTHATQKLALREPSDRIQRLGLGLYLCFVAVYSLTFGFFMARQAGPYLTGEWLINYSGGFVRRGLIGAVVLVFSHATRIPLTWVVFALQAAVLVVFFGCVYKLAGGIRWTYLMAAVVLSPATLAFTVVDSYAGIRKEFLLFAALALVLCTLIFGRLRDWQLSATLSLIAVGLALSHEALMVGAPYFFAAVAVERGGVRRALKICLVPLLLGGATLLAVVLHPGNHAIAQAVCNSVGGTLGPVGSPEGNICSGSIAWLQLNLQQARDMVAPAISHYHRVRLYGWLAIPTFAPVIAQLVLLWRRDRLGREIRTILWCALISLGGTGFLFYIALDWGRWMHIQAICLMLMVLMADRRAPKAEPATHHRRWVRYASTLAVILYATTWTLPPTRAGDGQRGYLDVVRLIHSLWRQE